VNLVFLVYDSRSGSTLLSREIAARFPGVYVTPEIRFDRLFGRRPAWWRAAGAERIGRILAAGRVPEKLEVPPAEISRLAAAASGVRPLVEGLLAAAGRRADGGAPRQAIIKSGRHLRAGRRILRDIPDARFLFIVRDPRAAIASKLATDRPYRPGQKMAWAGTFAAALQWRWYARLARGLARRAPLHALRYETLLARHAEVMQELAGFLGSEPGTGAGRYRIPDAERAIHARVLAEGVDALRAEAWRRELAGRDQAVIELACGSEMRRWGYEPELRTSPLRAAGLLAAAAATSAGRVLRESCARLARRHRAAG
jgi:hypothetical protein